MPFDIEKLLEEMNPEGEFLDRTPQFTLPGQSAPNPRIATRTGAAPPPAVMDPQPPEAAPQPTVDEAPADSDFAGNLADARAHERDASRRALMFQAFDQIAKAGSGGLNASDNAYWDAVAKNGKGDVEDVKNARDEVSKTIADRLKKQEETKHGLEVERLKSRYNTDSRESQVARAIMERRLRAAGIDPNVLGADASAQDVQDLEHGVSGLESAATRRQNAQLHAALIGAKQANGKTLTAEQSERIAAHDASLQQLDDLEKAFDSHSDIVGPIAGRRATFNPYNTEAQSLDALAKTSAQNLGKSLEGGKLTDQDIVRYRDMLPMLKDTPAVAKRKIEQARRMVLQRRQSELGTFGSAGYNTGKFNDRTPNKAAVVDGNGSGDPRVRQALQAGYTPEEVEAYLRGRK
jgi:hypothetical protein